jgi:hypothetical protein
MTYPYPWSGDINIDPASVPSPVYAIKDANGNVVGLGVGGEIINASIPDYVDIHSIPLTHALTADVGDALTHARTGAGAVVDCYGSLQFTRSGEARFWGARRVENLVADDTFTSGWTLGSNTTKALRSDILGPYRNRRNVYQIDRTTVNGAIITKNSTAFRAGKYAASIWLGGNGTVQYTIAIQRNGGDNADVVTATVTPPASGLVRYAISADLPNDGYTYKFQVRSTTVTLSVRMACAQFEWVHGQDGAPNDYVPRGSSYDSAPYYGCGVDGVRYFDTLNPWSVSSGVATKSTTDTPIAPDTLKGIIVGPTRVNKFYESRNPGAGSWTLTGVTGGAYSDSTLLGISSLRKIEESTATSVHGISQVWHGTLPADDAMITVAVFAVAGERSALKIGFTDKAGADKFAWVNVATMSVVSETGDVPKTHITKIGDLVRIGYTDTAGVGATAPIGFYRMAATSGTESYAGTLASGMSLGGMQFERTDHPCIYLGDTATSTPAGTGDDTTALVLSSLTGQNGWSVECDATTMYDSDSQSKTSWSYIWYATVASNLRFGCGIRPGEYGGAIVEDYVKNPVFDCYAGPDGVGVPQINPNTGLAQDIFDVCNCLHITPALQTVRWQIALHQTAYDGASNIAMMVGSTQGVLDSNGTHLVSKVPLSATVKLGYKGTPIDEKCIKNFRVSRPARTWAEMLEQTAAIE